MRSVPDFLDSYLEYASGMEGNALTHYWCGISALSAALERRVWLDRGYFNLFPNLYIFIVGDPGSRKTSSASVAVDILRSVDNVYWIEERLTPAALVETMSESQRFFEHNGIMVPQASLFAYAPELSVFLEDIGGGGLMSLLTTFFDAGPKDVDTPWVKRTVGGGTVSIKGPLLSILGCTTTDWLVRTIPMDAIGGGFTSRVLFVVLLGSQGNPVAYPIPPDMKLRARLVETLRHIHGLVGPMRETDNARKVFTDWYEDYFRHEMNTVPDDRFKGYAARKGDFLMKLAMLAAVSESDDLVITERHYGKAAILLDALESTMFNAFGSKGENERSIVIEKLYYSIPIEPDNINHSALLRKNWRHTSGNEFKADILTLVESKLVGVSSIGGQVVYYRFKDRSMLAANRSLSEAQKRIMEKGSVNPRVAGGNGDSNTDSPHTSPRLEELPASPPAKNNSDDALQIPLFEEEEPAPGNSQLPEA